MKIFYWSPFLTKIATEKAVINSIFSINKYLRAKIYTFLIEVIGEWQNQKVNIDQKKNKYKKTIKI